MTISVLTPGETIYEGAIRSVKVPGINGQFEILNNHAPIVSALGEGEVRILDEQNGRETFTISQGFVEVLNNKVSLLVQGVQRN